MYIYLTYGQQRLSFIAKIIEDAKPVNQVMDIELDEQWICRKIEVVKTPVINNTNDLKDKTGWLPSGYSTFNTNIGEMTNTGVEVGLNLVQ